MIFIHLVKIRILQLFREIRDVGLFRAVILLVILLPALALFLFQRLPMPGYNYGIPGVALLLVFMIHRNRRDYSFLAKLSNIPAGMYFVEYFIFSLPLLFLMAVCGQYLQAGLYVVLLFPVSMVIPSPKGVRAYNAWIKYIPAGMFEWQSGIRMSLPFILLFFATGLAGVFSIWFAVASVALLSLTFGSFYGDNESQQMLAALEQSPVRFLKSKLKRHVGNWALFLLPLFLIALVHHEYVWYILAAYLAAMNLLVFAILSKYAFYRPATTGGLSQLIGSLAWLCTVFLPLSAIVLAANILLFFKAKHHLNDYLDAYH